MTLTAYVAMLLTIVGALVYIFAKPAKAVELGRIAFFVGLLWTIYAMMGKVLRIG